MIDKIRRNKRFLEKIMQNRQPQITDKKLINLKARLKEAKLGRSEDTWCKIQKIH
jgi:hypothetical protein